MAGDEDGNEHDARLLQYLPDSVVEWEAAEDEWLPLGNDAAWDTLRNKYEARRSTLTHNLLPWRRCLAIAKASGAVCAVVEKRYICYDFQSEFTAFYSHVLAPIPSTTHRIHFFRELVTRDNYLSLSEKQIASYTGYVVCRPRDLEIVGRTMLAPPEGWPILATVEDPVTFFGQRLTVIATPFMQQDERIGVCANVVAWIVHYSAYRKSFLHRRVVAEFLHGNDDQFRPKSASGLETGDLIALLDGVGFRTSVFSREQAFGDLPFVKLPWHSLQDHSEYDAQLLKAYEDCLPDDLSAELSEAEPSEDLAALTLRERLVQKCCRYLNSGLPVIAGALDHSFVVCGYELTHDERIADLFIQDDQVGPYVIVQDVLLDRRDLRETQGEVNNLKPPPIEDGLQQIPSPEEPPVWIEWIDLLTPLPPSVYLPLHDAEDDAIRLLEWNLADAARKERLGDEPVHELAEIRAAIEDDSLRLRTYLIQANEFKASLERRGASPAFIARLRSLRMSEFVIVVEYVNVDSGLDSHRCLAEVVYDATSNPKNPWVHEYRIGSTVSTVQSDGTEDKPLAVGFSSLIPGSAPYRGLEEKYDGDEDG